MEIRKTAGERDIEKQEVKIRRVASRTIKTGYRMGKTGVRSGNRMVDKAFREGIAQVKNGLRSKDIREQIKLLTPEQRKQWNSYSIRKQNEILEKAERIAERSIQRKNSRESAGSSDIAGHPAGWKNNREFVDVAPLITKSMAFQQELNMRAKGNEISNVCGTGDKWQVNVPVGDSAKSMRKNLEKGIYRTETFYTSDVRKGTRKALYLDSALKRQEQREVKMCRKIYASTVKNMVSREHNKQRMVREQQINDEITQMEAENAVASGYVSYAMVPAKAKIYQKAGMAVNSAVSEIKNRAVSLLVKCLPFLLPAILVISFFCFILTPSTSGGEYRGIAHVTPQVEFYRPYLEKYAALYPGMEKLVDLMLAMIMQEAGGEPWIGTMDGDIMQSSESAGYPGPGYLTGEASIEQGVKYLATEVFNRAGLLEDPYNLDKTKLALQGYNYGAGYIPWALNNYGGYTEANAVIFSDMMAARLGWSAYGDKLYVQHVLRYYEIRWVGMGNSVSTTEIMNQETKNRLEELSASWPSDLDEGRKNIIVKGCTLAGYTTYDMYGADTRAGVDFPRTLDCSSFTAWCFQKCGYTDVPYWSTTGTFLGASNFRQINASELKPGDIGLINWVGSGGSNHVGIFVGRDSGGNAMWLHCTSHQNSGSSIVTGPRISYYSAFSLFFRYTGFH